MRGIHRAVFRKVPVITSFVLPSPNDTHCLPYPASLRGCVSQIECLLAQVAACRPEADEAKGTLVFLEGPTRKIRYFLSSSGASNALVSSSPSSSLSSTVSSDALATRASEGALVDLHRTDQASQSVRSAGSLPSHAAPEVRSPASCQRGDAAGPGSSQPESFSLAEDSLSSVTPSPSSGRRTDGDHRVETVTLPHVVCLSLYEGQSSCLRDLALPVDSSWRVVYELLHQTTVDSRAESDCAARRGEGVETESGGPRQGDQNPDGTRRRCGLGGDQARLPADGSGTQGGTVGLAVGFLDAGQQNASSLQCRKETEVQIDEIRSSNTHATGEGERCLHTLSDDGSRVLDCEVCPAGADEVSGVILIQDEERGV